MGGGVLVVLGVNGGPKWSRVLDSGLEEAYLASQVGRTPVAEGLFFRCPEGISAVASLFAVSHLSCFRIAQNQCECQEWCVIALPCPACQE